MASRARFQPAPDFFFGAWQPGRGGLGADPKKDSAAQTETPRPAIHLGTNAHHSPTHPNPHAPSLKYGSRARTCLLALGLLGSACESPKDFEQPHVEITASDCGYCHEPDYTAAKSPLHRIADKDLYPQNCGACHETQRFRPARFSHPFPLDGQHALTACWQCHVGTPPLFAGTPSQCLGCHADAFGSSSFPGHASFEPTCLDCHSTSGWTPATGPHPEAAFPIASGVHNYPCLDCHDKSRGENARGNTNCVGCHEGVHAREVLDPIHLDLGLSDYPTGEAPPNFCLSCHPSGSL